MTAVPVTISVVMAVRNGAGALAQTVDSVLRQEGCDFELIVVDDGSIDEVPALLARLQSTDPRLRVITQTNAGLTRALVAGCGEARGQFIARIDAGDIALPGRLSAQAEALHADADLTFVSCVTRIVEPQGRLLLLQRGTGAATFPARILAPELPHGVSDGPSAHASVMFRRDAYVAVGGYRPEFYFGQDWDLWYRLAEVGKFQLIPRTLLEMSLGTDNISLQYRTDQQHYARLSREALRLRQAGRSEAPVLAAAEALRPVSRRPPGRGVTSAGLYFIGECLRRNRDLVPARQYFRRALRQDPGNWRAWIRLAQALVARTGSS